MKDLIPIGKMAAANRVTIATLRLYDQMGLLKPAYTDPDSGETGLVITDLGDGQFGISLSIFRLANFEDGRGELGEVSMSFNATDPAGNPISGKITLDGSTATVTFLDSSWDLISNGDSFRYEKN